MRRHLDRMPLFVLAISLTAGSIADAQIAAPARAPTPPPITSKPHEPTAKQIARSVQKLYDRAWTFQADFKQRYHEKANKVSTASKGRVAFQKPGKMSWRYRNGNRIVSDGKIVKVYEPANKQVYEVSAGKSQYPAALAFLAGGGKLENDFKLRRLSTRSVSFAGGYVIEGVPKTSTPAYAKVLLYIDDRSYRVRRVLFLDAAGNRNRLDFENPKLNVKIPGSEFRFQPPPGTRVVRP